MEGGALHDDAAKIIQINEIGKFNTITKGPGRGHNRIFKPQFTYIYLEISHCS